MDVYGIHEESSILSFGLCIKLSFIPETTSPLRVRSTQLPCRLKPVTPSELTNSWSGKFPSEAYIHKRISSNALFHS